MSKSLSKPLLLALLAALIALLVAWFVPLPRLVLSDEEKAAARMHQDRADVESARLAFSKAESDYKAYVASHDVGAALDKFEHSVQAVQSNASDPSLRDAVQVAAQPVLDYLAQLHAYSHAGEIYFATLSHYDDELMAWTRSLGSESDALRPDTWPIVEYLKQYPPPVGETTSYTAITASQVESNTAALQLHLGDLKAGGTEASAASANSGGDAAPVPVLAQDIANVRSEGRSVEYIESIHPQYDGLLTQYDAKVQSVATGSDVNSLSSGRVAFATGLDILLGAIIVVGLAAIFMPARFWRPERSQ